MRIISGTASGALRLGALGADLSKDARRRLKWMDYYEAHGRNAALTCRYFGISRQTFYRWRRRYHPRRLQSLEERPRRPRRVRQPTWSPELAQAVQELRETYPRWGKDKLAPLLPDAGWPGSPPLAGRAPPRPYAVRKPKDSRALQPGDIVQVDTLDLRPLPGVVLKHFPARDVVSRWDVVEVYSVATARTASAFLDALKERSPFTIRAIQVDGGSEFMGEFETACQGSDLQLFVLPPRSPKLNG